MSQNHVRYKIYENHLSSHDVNVLLSSSSHLVENGARNVMCQSQRNEGVHSNEECAISHSDEMSIWLNIG